MSNSLTGYSCFSSDGYPRKWLSLCRRDWGHHYHIFLVRGRTAVTPGHLLPPSLTRTCSLAVVWKPGKGSIKQQVLIAENTMYKKGRPGPTPTCSQSFDAEVPSPCTLGRLGRWGPSRFHPLLQARGGHWELSSRNQRSPLSHARSCSTPRRRPRHGPAGGPEFSGLICDLTHRLL